MSGDLLWHVKNGEALEVADLISRQRVDINEMIEGRYPLHFAADYGQTEIIELLLKNGAKVNLEDRYGVTPLLTAIFEGHTSSVKLLLEKGARKDGKSPDGRSYLECAETEDIKKLLK